MAGKKYIVSIDQGTTSSRALLVDVATCTTARIAKADVVQHYPEKQSGWIEHSPEQIWESVYKCVQEVLEGVKDDVVAFGITNQRETAIMWNRTTSKPVYPAIVWQDRRTSTYCEQLYGQNHNIDQVIADKTGLLLDPYFSATKIRWILNNVEGLRERAAAGDILFGTVDSWLLWKLTGGAVHATDASNASRTMLFNIHTQSWDEDLLALFEVPANILPVVRDSAAFYGTSCESLFGRAIPIHSMIGDQMAAVVGQACLTPGMAKSTYGTGCFLMLNTGDKVVKSAHRLVATTLFRINGKPTYGLEGSIFIAGASIHWLKEGLQLIEHERETDNLATAVEDNGGVYLIPAFTGLGAPYWDPQARGALLGLTRSTHIAHIVRAALEAVCYQTRDLLHAMEKDARRTVQKLRVDGGMASNSFLQQFLADMTQTCVDVPVSVESTSLGAAFLAGLSAGVYPSLDHMNTLWQHRVSRQPNMSEEVRQKNIEGWYDAMKRITPNHESVSVHRKRTYSGNYSGKNLD